MTDKSRGFVFTVYGYDKDDRLEKVKKNLSAAQYVIFGKEMCPDTGRLHLQGYFYMKNRIVKRSAVKMMFPSYCEIAVGSAEHNITYCSKDKHVYERGVAPAQGKRSDLTTFVEDCKLEKPTEQSLIEDHGSVTARYPGFVDRVVNFYHKPEDLPMGESCNLWYHGVSQTGKSTAARALCEREGVDLYSKNMTEWWNGYLDEHTVLIEDVDVTHRKLGYPLKIFADRFAFRCQIKNRTKVIRPKRIIVTSNYTIEELRAIWPEKIYLAIKSRFTQVKFIRVFDGPR